MKENKVSKKRIKSKPKRVRISYRDLDRKTISYFPDSTLIVAHGLMLENNKRVEYWYDCKNEVILKQRVVSKK